MVCITAWFVVSVLLLLVACFVSVLMDYCKPKPLNKAEKKNIMKFCVMKSASESVFELCECI